MSYSSEVLADAPLTYLRLGETSGTTALDASGNGRNGTYYGSPTLGAASLVNNDTDPAVSFDGVDDYVEIPSAPWMNLTTFAVEFVITPTAKSPFHYVATRGTDSGGTTSWIVSLSSGGVLSFGWVTGTGTSGSWTPTNANRNGTRTHVVYKVAGTSLTAIVNGTVYTNTISSNIATPSQPIRFGNANSTGYSYQGIGDEFAFYGPTVPSNARFQAHYSALTAPAPVAGLSGTAFLPTITATGTLDASLPSTLAGAATLPLLAADLQAETVPVITATTNTRNRANGRTRVGSGENWTAPLAPTVTGEPVRIMAQQLPKPTLRDGRPV